MRPISIDRPKLSLPISLCSLTRHPYGRFRSFQLTTFRFFENVSVSQARIIFINFASSYCVPTDVFVVFHAINTVVHKQKFSFVLFFVKIFQEPFWTATRLNRGKWCENSAQKTNFVVTLLAATVVRCSKPNVFFKRAFQVQLFWIIRDNFFF